MDNKFISINFSVKAFRSAFFSIHFPPGSFPRNFTRKAQPTDKVNIMLIYLTFKKCSSY